MRFDLRLHGHTSTGQRCIADLSVYANSAAKLQSEARLAATNAPWHAADQAEAWIADKETITVERVEQLRKPRSRK
jgi:hypothetical protein